MFVAHFSLLNCCLVELMRKYVVLRVCLELNMIDTQL